MVTAESKVAATQEHMNMNMTEVGRKGWGVIRKQDDRSTQCINQEKPYGSVLCGLGRGAKLDS